jgi:ADP-heptose:LPS heptosyltransferase
LNYLTNIFQQKKCNSPSEQQLFVDVQCCLFRGCHRPSVLVRLGLNAFWVERMNVQAMRLVDKWVGVPACFCLTAFDKLKRLFAHPVPGPVRRILFVKPAEQGATVLAYPAILKAVEKVGRGNVYFLVFDSNRHILDVMNVVPPGNVITAPSSGLFRTVAGFIKAILRIRREKIDTALDFEFFARVSAIICYLSGAARRIGLHSYSAPAPYRGNLFTRLVPYDRRIHTIETYNLLFDAIDAPARDLPATNPPAAGAESYDLPPFAPSPDESRQVRQLLSCDPQTPVIILNANAGDLLPLRCWPSANYVELARMLLGKYPDVHIVFTGGKEEALATERLVSQVNSSRCTSLGGRTTFRQLMTLYTMANLLVTNDSGPAHFASLTPIRTLVLFGPETPLLFGPVSSKAVAMDAGLPCSPCISVLNGRYTACRDNICMKAITVEQVFEQACRLYDLSLAQTDK